MRGKVLGTRKSRITAKLLAEKLECTYGQYCETSEGRYDYIFRYGNTINVKLMPKVIFNKAFSINRVSNKLQMRRDLIVNGIPVPKVYGYDNLTPELFERPLIARPNHHMKGRNFNLIYDLATAKIHLNKGHYLQEVIDNDIEYRIFVWKDAVFETNVKEATTTFANKLIRSLSRGWTFKVLRRRDVPQEIKDYSVLAVKASGLDFGAVDCCIDKKGNCYIFEINSAPSLFERKVIKLADKVKLWLGENDLDDSPDRQEDELEI